MSKIMLLVMSTVLYIIFYLMVVIGAVFMMALSHRQGWNFLLSFMAIIIPLLILSGTIYESRIGLQALSVLTNCNYNSEEIKKIQDKYSLSWKVFVLTVVIWALFVGLIAEAILPHLKQFIEILI